MPAGPGNGQGGGRGDGSGGGRRWQQEKQVKEAEKAEQPRAIIERGVWTPSKRERFAGLWTSEWNGDRHLVPAQRRELPQELLAQYEAASALKERRAIAMALVDSAMGFGSPATLHAWGDTLLVIADDDPVLRAKAHMAKGEALLRDGRMGRAFDDLRAALQLVDESADPSMAAFLHARIGDGIVRMGGLTGAAQRYEEVLRIGRGAAITDRLLLHAHAALAFIANDAEQWVTAVEHHEAALQLARSLGDAGMQARALQGLAMIADRRGDVHRAREQYRQAEALLESHPQLAGDLITMRLALGESLFASGATSDARAQLRSAMQMADSLEAYDAAARARLFLAAASDSDHRAALDLLDETDAIAKRHGFAIIRKEAALDRADRLAALGRHQEALGQVQEALRLADSLNLAFWAEGQRRQRQRSEVALKDRDIADLEVQKSEQQERIVVQRELLLVTTVAAIIVLVLTFFAYRAYRLQRRAAREIELAHAETLREKQRAEESERAKDRFLANMSHEVRTPLNAIIGFTDILLQEHRDARTRGFLEAVQGAGENLLVVINDLLDLGRMEAGRLSLVQEPFDLRATVQRAAQLLEHRARERGNEVVVDIDEAAPHWVIGDGARLSQILLNLMGNALKFTEEGEVRVSILRDGGDLRIRVSDTGIGIPKDKLGAIFDRFTQVDVTDQRRHGGAGLGLSIVKELVVLHHGRIEAQSEPGKGSTFTVWLPYAATQEPQAEAITEAQRPSTASLRGRVVLVAEDNELNAIVTTEVLKRHYPGARVEVVEDGRAAVDRLLRDAGEIALVLMDVQMPVLDGISATRELRASAHPIARVPIIALTASVLPADLSRCIEAGMDACVSKPFRAMELVQTIARLTGDAGAAVNGAEAAADPYAELFHQLVPERLQRLREAVAQHDFRSTHRLAHILRPQLVHRNATRFGPPCDALLALQAGENGWRGHAEQLIGLLEQELA